MKQLFTLIFTIISTISYGQSYPDSGFKVNFPTEPTIQKEDKKTKVGDVKITVYTCETEGFLIMISDNKLPAELIDVLKAKEESDKTSSGINNMLKGGKDGALKALSAQMGLELTTVSDEFFLFKNTFTALKSKAKIGEYDLVGLYIFKNNQMFQILIMGDVTSKNAEDFLNSFEFI